MRPVGAPLIDTSLQDADLRDAGADLTGAQAAERSSETLVRMIALHAFWLVAVSPSLLELDPHSRGAP
jgi:hypothetical protein